jgi:hypothetical protein
MMRKLFLGISILALILLPLGCLDFSDSLKTMIQSMLEEMTATYTINVTGSAGMNFTGEYRLAAATFDEDDSLEFSTDSFHVSEVIPPEGYVEYTVSDVMSIAGMFQKQSDGDALLRVELWRDGVLVDEAQTELPKGAVLVVAFSS